MIIVDTREPVMLARLISEMCPVRRELLSQGDYLIGGILVERKSLRDLLDSVASNRIMVQMQNLKECQVKYLLIEGVLNWQTIPNVAWLCKTMNRITIEYGVPILWSPSMKQSAYILYSLLGRESSHSNEIQRMRKKVPIARRQLGVLMALPGIGEASARRILDVFESPGRFLVAPRQEWEHVGIGKTRRRYISAVLDEAYKS
ncbi:hypothetical protein HY641_05160 [Candidatus Woesearchaeota archaeon]|nr:hypothetical protein [Candidatus Woesearchaeota archaeon]